MTARPEHIGRVLEQVAAWTRVLGETRARPLGDRRLSRSQTDALFLLARAKRPLTPGRLAGALHLTPGAVTQLLEGLRRAELVTQGPHPDDARSQLVTLSPAARQRVSEFEQATITSLADRFAALDDTELANLAALLARTRTLA